MSLKNLIFTFILIGFGLPVYAHFQMIIPSNDVIGNGMSNKIKLDIRFTHPMEGHLMNMEKPVKFGVKSIFTDESLLENLKTIKDNNLKRYTSEYTFKRPGDYIFYLEPAPYWEPDEDCYIIHYTKVIVNAFGMEKGWDKLAGLKTEIEPLVRPYGLWTGNIFRGVVLLDNKPVPYAEIEVEYYNRDNSIKLPNNSFITQVIKADKSGVFSYAIPKEGWWGFAALTTSDKKMKSPDGRMVNIELGAIIWVKATDIKK